MSCVIPRANGKLVDAVQVESRYIHYKICINILKLKYV